MVYRSLRVNVVAVLPSHPGTLEYQDGNYAERTGWKEIVIAAGNGVSIAHSSQGSKDRSHALETYPANEIAAPPQDLRSAVNWSVLPVALPVAAHLRSALAVSAPPATVAGPAFKALPTPSKSFTQQQPQPMGTLVPGDYLSRMLRNRKIPFSLALIGVVFAFCLGAMHAFSPGHGKTIVAAYLVGTRGTLKHAVFLGGMVTFTHTISVFALGLGVLFFQQYIVPEQIIPILGAISGLSIVAIGLLLVYQRTKALAERNRPFHVPHVHDHDHSHHHAHSHEVHHEHAEDHAHSHVLKQLVPSHTHFTKFDEFHSHSDQSHLHDHIYQDDRATGHIHAPDDSHIHGHHSSHQHQPGHAHLHVHSHGGRPHSHMPEGKVSLGSLIALGVSGGLVPCPSALILLLSAIALGRTGLGLVLLLGFSAGLALVLMAIGGIVIYAKRLLPEGRGLRAHPALRYGPVFSAVVVIILGLLMTGVSVGWITPRLAI